MGTFKSIRQYNVIGGNSSSPVIVATSAVSAVLTVTSGLVYLSVGDKLRVTAPGAGASYTIGTILTVEEIDHSTDEITVDIAAGAISAGLAAVLTSWDTDSFISASASSSFVSENILSFETSNLTIGSGAEVSIPLLQTGNLGEIAFMIDSSSIPAAVLQLRGIDSVTSEEVAICNLQNGDVFYSSGLENEFYEITTPATAIYTGFKLKNLHGAAVDATVKMIAVAK